MLIFPFASGSSTAGASLMAQRVKNPPAMPETQETWVWSLSQEDALEEEMTANSNILSWKILWTESLAGYRPKSQTWLSD